MFTQDELSEFYRIFQNNDEFIELDCGCTSPRYGDTPGILRVYFNGKLEIDCIHENCPRVNLSPIEFAKHAGRTNARHHWKGQIWVFNNEADKVQIRKTCLLKYHIDDFQRPLRQVAHRDEFIRCSQCGKDRRFSRRTREECRIYHQALLKADEWKCEDMAAANHLLTCDDAEEREIRKVCRGCLRDPKCPGCEHCVCFGCDMCRYEDCDCPECVVFIFEEL